MTHNDKTTTDITSGSLVKLSSIKWGKFIINYYGLGVVVEVDYNSGFKPVIVKWFTDKLPETHSIYYDFEDLELVSE